MGCFQGKPSDKETEPLLGDQEREQNSSQENKTKNPTKASTLEFARLEVQEFDRVFTDFAQTLNPFVTDREKLEQAVTKFKTAVESIQAVRPQATFREYLVALKTKLKDEKIFIKIKNGAVEVYGAAGRSIKAVEDAISAIKTIVAAGECLKNMPEVVTTASGSAVGDAESSLEDIENIIRREFSGVFDVCKIFRFKKNLKGNMEKLKNAPSMVKDFCQEVKVIIVEIGEVLEDKTPDGDDDNDDDDDDNGKNNKGDRKNAVAHDDRNNENAQRKETNEKDKDKDEDKDEYEEEASTSKQSTTKKEKKIKEKDEDGKKKPKKEEKKKEDYQKQLKMETVGLADIDKIFSDLATSLNKFVSTREKMQLARESFEKAIKTICNFDGKKELKDYLKELKEKAKEGKMQIYIDTRDGEIKLDSVKGIEPPAPYRNAVKAINEIKASAKETLDLEPVVERGIESCASDITKIEPLKDFKKLVSGVKETMALPKKIKAFNENRKKVQQAPQIVKELCLYVKQILQDTVNAFGDEKNEEKNEGTEGKDKEKTERKDEKNEEKNEGTERKDEEKTERKDEKNDEIVKAAIHAPRKPTKTEKVESNESTVVC